MVDGSGNLTWDRVADIFGATVAQPAGMTAANPLRFPGQQYDAATGLHYNHFRDYDPALGRYIQSDPIGLAGGVNTYAYVRGNPFSNYDPSGLRCIASVGCWTTPEERALLDSGNYIGYYQAACAGGDAYACFAKHIAANDNFWGKFATKLLTYYLRNHANESRQCIDESETLDQIRSDLANDYASYLPSSQDQARWPTVQGVTQFHWDEFAKIGLPPSAFAGTPFARVGWPIGPGIWCPNCK